MHVCVASVCICVDMMLKNTSRCISLVASRASHQLVLHVPGVDNAVRTAVLLGRPTAEFEYIEGEAACLRVSSNYSSDYMHE
jgi:hypothetical protein